MIFDRSDQGQVSRQHLPLWSRGASLVNRCHLCNYSTKSKDNIDAHYLATHDISRDQAVVGFVKIDQHVPASNELSTWEAHIKQEVDVGDPLDTATNASSLASDSSVSMKIEQFLNHASEVSPQVDVAKSLKNVVHGDNISNQINFSKMSASGTNCLLCANTATMTKLCGLCTNRMVSQRNEAIEERGIKRELGSTSDMNGKKPKFDPRVESKDDTDDSPVMEAQAQRKYIAASPKGPNWKLLQCPQCPISFDSNAHCPHTVPEHNIKEAENSFCKNLEEQELSDTPVMETQAQRNDSESYFPGIDQLSWYEGCIYGCCHCEAYYLDTSKMVDHVKRMHRKKYKLCRNVTKHILHVKTSYWDCSFCKTKIKRSKSCISGHISSKHGISSIEEFEKISGEGPPNEFDFIDVAVTVKQEENKDVGIEREMSKSEEVESFDIDAILAAPLSKVNRALES